MHVMCRLDDFDKSVSLNEHGAVKEIVDQRRRSPSVVSDACRKLIWSKTVTLRYYCKKVFNWELLAGC